MILPPRIDLSFDEHLGIIRRRWPWFFAPIVVFGALAVYVGAASGPEFTATATVLIADSAAQELLHPDGRSAGLPAPRTGNELTVASSDATQAIVEGRLGFLPDVEIGGIEETDVLEFTVTAPTSDDAARHANIWAAAYVETKQQAAGQSIDDALVRLEARLADLQAQRAEISGPIEELRERLAFAVSDRGRSILQTQVDREAAEIAPSLDLLDERLAKAITSIDDLELNRAVAGVGTAEVIQHAAPPVEESGRSWWPMAALALAVGSVLGVVLTLVVDALDKTVKTAADVVELTGTVVLGAIPRPGRELRRFELALVGRDAPYSEIAEGYRRTATALQSSALGRRVRSVLVTSADDGEGKTTTAANLAFALATRDERVALVDVDFRRPRLHRVLGVDPEPGLTDHLVDGVHLDETAWAIEESRLVSLITCGRIGHPNPAELVASAEFTNAIEDLVAAGDLVVLDGPAMLPAADAVLLARQVDGVVLTASVGTTRKDQLQRAVDCIAGVGGTVLGVVLVGARDSAAGRNGDPSDAEQAEPAAMQRWPREDLSLAGSTIDLDLDLDLGR